MDKTTNIYFYNWQYMDKYGMKWNKWEMFIFADYIYYHLNHIIG